MPNEDGYHQESIAETAKRRNCGASSQLCFLGVVLFLAFLFRSPFSYPGVVQSSLIGPSQSGEPVSFSLLFLLFCNSDISVLSVSMMELPVPLLRLDITIVKILVFQGSSKGSRATAGPSITSYGVPLISSTTTNVSVSVAEPSSHPQSNSHRPRGGEA